MRNKSFELKDICTIKVSSLEDTFVGLSLLIMEILKFVFRWDIHYLRKRMIYITMLCNWLNVYKTVLTSFEIEKRKINDTLVNSAMFPFMSYVYIIKNFLENF